MKTFLLIMCLILGTNIQAGTLSTEDNVDVSRYVGKWYAHYSLPQFFTRKCLGQTAEYEIINDKTISVLNTCLKKKGVKTITGQATIVNPGINSRLEVTFNNFFTRLFRVKGDYNILKLDEDYQYVLVGSDNKESLWIMSRSDQEIPEAIKDIYFKAATEMGFDTSKLIQSRF